MSLSFPLRPACLGQTRCIATSTRVCGSSIHRNDARSRASISMPGSSRSNSASTRRMAPQSENIDSLRTGQRDVVKPPRPNVHAGRTGQQRLKTSLRRSWPTEAEMSAVRKSFHLRNMYYDEADFAMLSTSQNHIIRLEKLCQKLQQDKNDVMKLIASHQSTERNRTEEGEETHLVSDSSKNALKGTEACHTTDLEALRARATSLRKEAKDTRAACDARSVEIDAILLSWPNLCHPQTPIGPESEAVVVSMRDPLNLLPSEFDVFKVLISKSNVKVGMIPPGPGRRQEKDHTYVSSLLESGGIDMESGKVSTGSSWPYLLGTLSMLEHALTQYALSVAVQHGFVPTSTPDVVQSDLAHRCGFRPRDINATQTYHLKSARSDGDELCLAATAEIPLVGLVSRRKFATPTKPTKPSPVSHTRTDFVEGMELPVKLVAMGHAFRAEAGARGLDTRGLYRVHQFTKVEMFVVTESDFEKSNLMLESLREIQEQIVGGLGLAYRVLDMPTEELGASAYRKYDIEVWMPGRGSWGEVSSASNCTDYQATRLSIKQSKGEAPLHTLNATAAAVPRLIVSILETHGVDDGKLKLPDTLKPFWLGGPHDSNVVWLSTKSEVEALTKTGETKVLNTAKDKRQLFAAAMNKVRAAALRNQTTPSTMAASFLILHELTAIIPLVPLYYLFSILGLGAVFAQWLLGDDLVPAESSVVRRLQAWARLKEAKLERYFRRKGWLDEPESDLERHTVITGTFANALAAFLVVKILLPVRIGLSVALAGRFSRLVLEPVKRATQKLLVRKPSV